MRSSRRGEKSVPDPVCAQIVEDVLWGIEQIRERGDRVMLLQLRAALERKGGRPGPKRRPEANRWKIETLHEIAQGKPLKQSVRHPRRSPQSASAELGRFCQEFYWLCEYLDAREPKSWRKPRPARALRQEFGFRFPADLAAAQQAYHRGRAAAEKSLREFDRFRELGL